MNKGKSEFVFEKPLENGDKITLVLTLDELTKQDSIKLKQIMLESDPSKPLAFDSKGNFYNSNDLVEVNFTEYEKKEIL